MTNNQCAFSDTFTTLRARGLSQYPTDTATLVISIDSNGIIAVGSIVDSLPIAMPTTLGVMYGTPPSPTYVNSSLSLGANAIAAGTWSIAINNNVLISAKPASQCNVAVGSYNLQNMNTGQYNTAIGQGSMDNLTTGSSNVALGYEAGGSYEYTNSFQMGRNNIAIGNFSGSRTNNTAVSTTYILALTLSTGVSIMLGSGAT